MEKKVQYVEKVYRRDEKTTSSPKPEKAARCSEWAMHKLRYYKIDK